MDDDVRRPEELDHVGHHVDLAPAPVCAGVQEHPGHLDNIQETYQGKVI